jgi:hypothetical protein
MRLKEEMTMDWLQVLTLFLANAGLIIWFRAESRNDWRHMDAKLDAQINAMRQENKSFQDIVLQEMKDFHGRLCAIEERNKK